jgi:hypothetical protein
MARGEVMNGTRCGMNGTPRAKSAPPSINSKNRDEAVLLTACTGNKATLGAGKKHVVTVSGKTRSGRHGVEQQARGTATGRRLPTGNAGSVEGDVGPWSQGAWRDDAPSIPKER